MTCIIIEDEKVAAERLRSLIINYDAGIKIVEVIQSVNNAVGWFNSHTHPDLIFMDIQLADGLSFEIFEHTVINAPVIFTTAYEEYTLKAFKVNSIDYLLKPIDAEELGRAIDKFKKSSFNQQGFQYPQQVFDRIMHSLTKEYKTKFVIKVGEHIKVLKESEISCFFSMEKSTFLQTFQNREYAIDYSLEQLEELIDPSRFHRINRQYIVSFDSIKDIVQYSNSRLLLKILNNEEKELIVSRERVQNFKNWLER